MRMSPLVNHRNERIGPASPRVAIRDLLKKVWFLMKRLAADLDVRAEISADVERWIDVYQLQSAGLVDLTPQEHHS